MRIILVAVASDRILRAHAVCIPADDIIVMTCRSESLKARMRFRKSNGHGFTVRSAADSENPTHHNWVQSPLIAVPMPTFLRTTRLAGDQVYRPASKDGQVGIYRPSSEILVTNGPTGTEGQP